MRNSNTTLGVFIVCLKVLWRHKRYLYLLTFLLFFPLYILINRLFLFLDYLVVPEFEDTKIQNPIFIIGFNRSGTTFFHKFLSQSRQFTSSTAWDMVAPSILLRKLIAFFPTLLSKMKFDRIEKKDKGHEVKLTEVEEDEMLFFLHKLDSKWITNNLIPWMQYDVQFKRFSHNLGRDNSENAERNLNSFSFYREFCKRQIFLQKNKPILSKANPFVFRLDSLMKIFPDAKIVFIVRDPLETIPSYFSMQEKMKYGNMMTKQELKFYREETYKEIIDWYKETEVAQDKLESKNFVVFTYQDLTENLEKTIKQFFTFSNQKMTKEFKKILKKTISKKYVKKHQNKTVSDFGLSDKKIRRDFDFVYAKYFN